MTELEKRNNLLLEAGKLIRLAFQNNFYGSIEFNLKPDRKTVNLNIKESVNLENKN